MYHIFRGGVCYVYIYTAAVRMGVSCVYSTKRVWLVVCVSVGGSRLVGRWVGTQDGSQ